jgi:hypothetical protein
VGRRSAAVLIGAWIAVWTALVLIFNDAYDLTVSDGPGDGGAKFAARIGYFVLGAMWLVGVLLVAATVWAWRRR